MLIDGHTHIHPRRDGLGARFDATIGTLISELGKVPLQKAVVLALTPDVSNEFVAEACQRYSDQLIGFACVDPTRGVDSTSELEEAIAGMGLKGLKLHPRRQGFGLADWEMVVPFVQKAASLNVPVLFDAFPQGKGGLTRGEVELVDALANAVPEASLIMAHAGGHRLFDALVVAKAHRNVYLDISFTPQYYKGSSIEHDLAFVIRKVGAERAIYGSDYPEVGLGEALRDARRLLEAAGIDEQGMSLVLGGNIAALVA